MTKPYEIAKEELGVHETPGPVATARIAEYHSTTTLRAKSDEVPWCASFVNWCMVRAGLRGTDSAAARSWLAWGKPCDPVEGCVVVIRQLHAGRDASTGSASGYHVGFFQALDETHVTILGGNQSDSVKVSRFPLSRYAVQGYRTAGIR
jgi:uncharacterized protein (TIGR02594 family)